MNSKSEFVVGRSHDGSGAQFEHYDALVYIRSYNRYLYYGPKGNRRRGVLQFIKPKHIKSGKIPVQVRSFRYVQGYIVALTGRGTKSWIKLPRSSIKRYFRLKRNADKY